MDAVFTVGWIGNGTRYWCRNSVKDGSAFMLGDAATQRQPAFDRVAVAAAMEVASDASALLAIAWHPPEAFVTTRRDGTTDIYSMIVRPTNFDAKHTCAVSEVHRRCRIPRSHSLAQRGGEHWRVPRQPLGLDSLSSTRTSIRRGRLRWRMRG